MRHLGVLSGVPIQGKLMTGAKNRISHSSAPTYHYGHKCRSKHNFFTADCIFIRNRDLEKKKLGRVRLTNNRLFCMT
jgi:hypothetical protein